VAEVELKAVSKRFGATEVLKQADLDVRDGELVVLVGPSGCGKSTVLRLVAGLEAVTSGEILIGGRVVNWLPPPARRVAMVFQSYALYPHMTGFENMAFGLKLAKLDRRAIRERVHRAAEQLQIAELLDRKPKEMSGGQRQRVAIGRAIVREPDVFLFDEPLSNLDAKLRVQMRIEFANLHRQLATTMIYVTHDQVEAMTLADRIVLLNRGRVEQIGTPMELYNSPRTKMVAGFIGSPAMNQLEGTLEVGPNGNACVRTTAGTAIAVPREWTTGEPGQVTIGIRPEHLTLGTSADTVLTGEVRVVERLGSTSFLYVEVAGGDTLVAAANVGHEAKVGERVTVGIPARACYLFDANGIAVPRPGAQAATAPVALAAEPAPRRAGSPGETAV
jgi:multiple sugar transport system ATP-binding protein